MSRRRRFNPTIWHVVLVLPVFAIGLARLTPIRDNSFLWHVGAGRLQLSESAVLTADPFSFTRLGDPWRTQSWLADLGYAVMDSWAGMAYVHWMVWVMGSLFLVGMMLIAREQTPRVPVVAAFGVLTVLLIVPFLNPRPVLFSYLLFAMLVIAERHGRLRWTLPLILWLWASLHGSFVIGGGYVVLQAIRRRRWDAWKELSAAGVAVSVTAHGLAVWEILFTFLRNREGLDAITEWAHPNLLSLPMLPLLLGILLLIIGGIRGRIVTRDLVIVVPFLVLAFTANRSVPPAWIALAPFVATSMADISVPERVSSSRQGLLNGLLAALLVGVPLFLPAANDIDPERFPIDAATQLRGNRLFHDDSTGGYLIYAAWPDRLVYVDDRAELYGEMIQEFVAARGSYEVWREVFERYGIDEVLLPLEQPLVGTLELSGWISAYEDETFIVLVPPSG